MVNEGSRRIARALLSVHDKTGLAPLAAALAARGVALMSSGGTARFLTEAGLPVVDVASVTRFPEMLDGRVKTLHPAIHGGLLARRDRPDHLAALAAHGIAPIDLLVSNLYPFAATVARGAAAEDCIENIDIGGPALIRAAAKNHDDVVVVTDPGDYAGLLAEVAARDGATSLDFRRALAARAFSRTAAYDAAIAAWFAREHGETFPELLAIAASRRQKLRYGENPHQEAAFYVDGLPAGVGAARQLQGKDLSYNNLNDTDAAYALAAEFSRPAVAIIKHANPCGAAVAGDLPTAYQRALECDPVSAFGGVVAIGGRLTLEVSERIAAGPQADLIIASSYDDDALAQLSSKRKATRLLSAPAPEPLVRQFRSLGASFLVQDADRFVVQPSEWQVATKKQPTESQWRDLALAWKVCARTTSNAIAIVTDGQAVGVGAGQQSRVVAAELAVSKAESRARGGAAASDAFFPFPDGLLVLANAGVGAVVQPGGSIRDDEVMAAADEAGIAVVTTGGERHFRH